MLEILKQVRNATMWKDSHWLRKDKDNGKIIGIAIYKFYLYLIFDQREQRLQTLMRHFTSM